MRIWFLVLVLVLSVMNPGLFLTRDDYYTSAATDPNHFSMTSFIENKGQWDPMIRFMATTQFGHIGLGTGKVFYDIKDGSRGNVVVLSFGNSNPVGLGDAGYISNYIIGCDPKGWVIGVPSYSSIIYPEVWPGIDLVFQSSPVLKYELFLDAGANPDDIIFKVQGDADLLITKKTMTIDIGVKRITDSGLSAYQDDYKSIGCGFRAIGDDSYGFDIGPYDISKRLVIDPYINSARMGGSLDDQVFQVAVDPDGYIYLCGGTNSTEFPVTSGSYDTTLDEFDATVIKMDQNASRVIFATYVGGNGGELFKSISLDEQGNIYLTGDTISDDYPTTTGAISNSLIGSNDGTIVVMDTTGSKLLYSTYIGGSGLSDSGAFIFAEGDGIAYVSGETYSTNYPTTTGAYQTEFGGASDIWVLKIDIFTGSIIYSTFIGGDQWDAPHDMHIDDTGSVYLCGGTYSSDFPTTPNVNSRARNGPTDAFVLKLNRSGKALDISTYVGGSSHDRFYGITVLDDGMIYLAGGSESGDYPTTVGAYDRTFSGGTDIVLSIMDPGMTELLHSTYVGGSGTEYAQSIQVDDYGFIYTTGATYSADLPTTFGEDRSLDGTQDAFFLVMDGNLSTLRRSSYLGGSGMDDGRWMISNGYGLMVAIGHTTSSDFLSGGHTHGPGGDRDVFISFFADERGGGSVRFNPSIPVTGNEVRVTLEASDIDPEEAVFHYSIDGRSFTSILALKVDIGRFALRIIVPENASFLYHYEEYIDSDIIVRSTPVSRVSVIDDLPPIIVMDCSDRIAVEGHHYLFNLTFDDNIGIDQVRVVYHFDERPPSVLDLWGNDIRTGIIEIPFDVRTLFYKTQINDTSGNDVTSDLVHIDILGSPHALTFHEDMEIDPSWTSDATGDFYWDAGTFYISGGNGYVGTDVGFVNGSFHIEYDIIPDSFADGESVRFGLRSKTLSGTGQMVEFQFGAGIFGDYVDLRSVDTDGRMDEDRVLVDIIDGERYRARINFNSMDGRLSGELIRIDGFSTVAKISLTGIKGFNELRMVGSSNLGTTDDPATARVDDIFLFIERLDDLIEDDLTFGNPFTGDPFLFQALLKDHENVTSSFLEYQFDDGPISSLVLQVNRTVGSLVLIPQSSFHVLYRFLAYGFNGIEDSTEWMTLPVLDNDPPVLSEDLTVGTAIAGSGFDLKVVVEDNRIVNIVRVRYWADDSEKSDVELSGNRTYSYTVIVPKGGIFYYQIMMEDDSGNYGSGPLRMLQIIDGSPPQLELDASPDSARTGSLYVFDVRAIDDSGQVAIQVKYVFGNGTVDYWTELIKDGMSFTGTISLPVSLMTSLTYILHLSDEWGNSIETPPRTIKVMNPLLSDLPLDPIVLYVGQDIRDRLTLPSGIVVSEMRWVGEGRHGYGMPYSSGSYILEITLADSLGLTHMFSVLLHYLPIDHDTDGDGIPDLVEIEMGLNPDSASDGESDLDQDGLTNLEEYLNGTDIKDPDTDGDGMPDGWEVLYGLDPLKVSGGEDTDGDGRTDLEEYLLGSNPRKKDVSVGSEGFRIKKYSLVLIVILIMLLIATIIFLAMSLGRVNRRIREFEGQNSEGGTVGERIIVKKRMDDLEGIRFIDPMDPKSIGVALPKEEDSESEIVMITEDMDQDNQLNNKKKSKKKYPVYCV